MRKTICYCKDISITEIDSAIGNGAKTLKDIKTQTGACTGNQCATLNPSGECCSEDIKALLKKPATTKNDCCCCT